MSLDPQQQNVVVIGASAGGVQALTASFQRLPATLPAAVLVVLHILAHTRSELQNLLNATMHEAICFWGEVCRALHRQQRQCRWKRHQVLWTTKP